jgi:hypothetical protein
MATDKKVNTTPDVESDTPDPGDFDVTTLRNLESFDDAVALLTDTYGELQDATKVIGSGFSLTDTNGKYRLIGEPFVIIRMTFPQSTEHKDADTGEWLHYAVLHIMTRDGRKLIITDGGVGIYRQCEEWAVRESRHGGLYVPGGLRVSEYDLPDGSGQGMTYYLAV